jgi:5,10-methylenetetrahydromethanopterin reductase
MNDEEDWVNSGERLGFGLPGQPSVREMMVLAKQAEELGFDSVWLTETRFTRDAITTASAVAAATSRVRIGTAVTNPFTRGAVLSAVTFATLDELAQGRAIFGFGPGSPHILRRQGYDFDLPVTRMTEHIEVVRQLLTGERVTYRGRTVSVDNVSLDFTPCRTSMPLYLGVTGPKALALAGELADGVILNGFVSADYSARAVERVRAAATRAGRNSANVDIASWLMVSVDRNSGKAKDAVRPMVATYLANFPNIARESGLPGKLLDTIGTVFAADGAAAAAAHVTDEIVTQLAVAGTSDECRALIRARRDAGVTLPILGILGRGSDIGAAMKDLVATG